MKKTLLLLILLTASRFSYSQNLNCSDMVQLCSCISYLCFNDYLTIRGFKLEEQPNLTDNADVYGYMSTVKFWDSKAATKLPNTCLMIISKDKKSTNVGFRTVDENKYRALLAEFKERGFTFVNKSEKSNGYVIYFKSSSYVGYSLQLSLDTWSQNGVSWLSYDFELEKDRM